MVALLRGFEFRTALLWTRWPEDDVAVVPADATSIVTSSAWRNPVIVRPYHYAAKFVPTPYFSRMTSSPSTNNPTPSSATSAPAGGFADPSPELTETVESYRKSGDLGLLFDRLKALTRRFAPDLLRAAAEPYRELPEVVIPIYDSYVDAYPTDAQAIVILANAYWLTGRGHEAVGRLATRAIAADEGNRGAWHLWALSDPEVRGRVERWQKVTERFPADQLARAALADNATSLAHDEQDPLALDLAISTYQGLLREATAVAQRLALESTLKTLRGWKL